MWLAKAIGSIAPSARAFLLKSCSSLRRCTARAPDRSGWSVCRVCSPHRPSALLRVHTLNFTSQFQHTRRPRERVLETCPVRPSYGRSTSRIGRCECLYEEICLPCGSCAPGTGCTSLHGRYGAAPAQTTRRTCPDPACSAEVCVSLSGSWPCGRNTTFSGNVTTSDCSRPPF